MKDRLKVGVLIADDSEYAPLRQQVGTLGAVRADFFSREGHVFSLKQDGKTIEIHTVLCGIGMVNAASAATALALEGCDMILNAGLSGGVSGIARNEMMLGTKYIEHDFDMTPLGYAPCEKPGQDYYQYDADPDLISLFAERYPTMKQGVAVSGDCFISSKEKRDFLKNAFDAMSCDMESAAIAYVCSLAGVRYLSLRRISDDAGEDAMTNYREMNDAEESVLVDLLLDTIRSLFDHESFWRP